MITDLDPPMAGDIWIQTETGVPVQILAVSGGQVVIRADQAPHADQDCGATDLARFIEDYRPRTLTELARACLMAKV